jgi:hypothetical protein
MKIPLSAQLAEAELHRNALAKALPSNPALEPRLDRSEAICLTLAMIETYEPQFRAFMAKRSKGTA